MTFRHCPLVYGFLLASVLACFAAKPEPIPPAPPMAQARNVSIYRGRTVDIPLQALGRAPSQLKFFIRTSPKHGRLGAIRMTGNKSAVVAYTHDSRSGEAGDTFTYAVQSVDSPVSAPGQITITISEEPPAFSVVHAMDFGRVLLGETHEEEITIRNSGGGFISGDVLAPPGWEVLGPKSYSMARMQEQKVRLRFTPTEERDYSGRLGFSHDARAWVDVTGIGMSPFDFRPHQEIELTASDAGSMRSGGLVIRNITTRGRQVDIAVPDVVVAPESADIPSMGEVRIPLHTRSGFLGSAEGHLVIESEGFRREIPLRVFALLPVLRIEPHEGLDFGTVEPGRRYMGALRIKNSGGLDAWLRAETPDEILLIPNPNTAILAPGETRIFEVAFEPKGLVGKPLEIVIKSAGGREARLPVRFVLQPAPRKIVKVPTSELAEVVEAAPLSEQPRQINNIPPIKDVVILKVGKRDIEIGWQRPSPEAVGQVVEVRSLEFAPTGLPVSRWSEATGTKFLEENGLIVARFENLVPGQVWFIRLRSMDRTGLLSMPSATLRIATPAPKGIGKGVLWFLAGLIAVAAAYGIRFAIRLKREEAAIEAERIRQLEKR